MVSFKITEKNVESQKQQKTADGGDEVASRLEKVRKESASLQALLVFEESVDDDTCDHE